MKSLPRKFTRIDEVSQYDHSYLSDEDSIIYLGEYTARKGFSYSDTNQVIFSLKKPMDRRGRAEWKYKMHAISECSNALSDALGKFVNEITFVPVPPSKSKTHAMYDDRILRILNGLTSASAIDIREIIFQRNDRKAAHECATRPNPEDLHEILSVDNTKIFNPHQNVAIFDDVITTGASFKAMKRRLAEVWPDANIIGIYLARRVPEAHDFSEFFTSFEE